MKVIIEIPKGDDRRRHIMPDKSGFVDLGPIKDVIPVNLGVMPIHYGYIPETLNKKEGDEIDIVVFSSNDFKVGQEVEVEPIALIRRDDGDDKVVAVDESMKSFQKWTDAPEAERKLIEDFFGYHHKFVSIEDTAFAKQYVEDGREEFLSKQK